MELSEFLSRFTDCNISFNEKLSMHSGYKTGGRAKFFITPKSVKSLSDTVGFCADNGLEYVILGNGTNVLFSDRGFNGAVISTKKLNGVRFTDGKIIAACGTPLKKVCDYAQKLNLTGIENLSGIPATVGGAAVMNAGAFGKDMASVVSEVVAVKNGKIIKYRGYECGFSYRKSRFIGNGEIVISVSFALARGDKGEIARKTIGFTEKRKSSQPSGRTCGSVFSNPENFFAASLIEKAGLKGFKAGGAKISPVHANFIVTESGATSTDVYALIKTVKEIIKEKYGVFLKEEIIYVGEFD